MELGMEGKVALVTGGSRGIGKGIARGLALEGCDVAICSRDDAVLKATAEELKAETGRDIAPFQADLMKTADAEAMVEAAVAHFGRIDILVNNAGAIGSGEFLEMADEQWIQDWALKPLGFVRMARAVFPIMSAQGGGRIINIVGVAARNPRHTYLAGGAANAALVNFTKGLAELGAPENILVTAVSPGPIMTARRELQLEQEAQAEGRTIRQAREALEATQLLGRMAQPEDVADLVCFIVSARASFLTGICVTIDGGASRGVYL